MREAGRSLARLLDPVNGFQAQNRLLEPSGDAKRTEPAGPLVNRAESPLQRLHQRAGARGLPWIDAMEYEAGERLRRDFEQAGLARRISANWIASVSSGRRSADRASDISDFAIDARRRLERAIDAMDSELSGVAIDVCCFLKGLETVERERRWPPRSAKLMLRTALRMLVRHYGLRTGTGSRASRHWGSGDYRPSI